MDNTYKRKSLLSSNSLVQAPWVKVTIGTFTFGVFNRSAATTKNSNSNYRSQKAIPIAVKDADGFYSAYNVQYPNYVTGLSITKINGQVNQYVLNISYPVRPEDDPNFFEKVFSSVSGSRKIIFSYGDSSTPSYVYKDEEALITNITNTFSFGSGGQASTVINYTVHAVSSAALGTTGSYTFYNSGLKKPSDEIKKIFKNKSYGLQNIFTGMNLRNLDALIDGSDKAVELYTKTNISPLDYILYLVSCMIPSGDTAKNNISNAIYILTIHDDTIYDQAFNDKSAESGPYFKVTKVDTNIEHSDAYEIDIGYNTKTIVTDFSIDQQENYALYYDYQQNLHNSEYVSRLNNNGEWENTYAPTTTTSTSSSRVTNSSDITWWTKITQYPIKATLTIQGLVRPATLMTYVRLNIIFTGGHKHIGSGLYIVTKQQDRIDGNGYRTTLSLTRISS